MRLLGELYEFYASVYNHARDMSRHASVSVCPIRFHPVIASIISQYDSFIGPSCNFGFCCCVKICFSVGKFMLDEKRSYLGPHTI